MRAETLKRLSVGAPTPGTKVRGMQAFKVTCGLNVSHSVQHHHCSHYPLPPKPDSWRSSAVFNTLIFVLIPRDGVTCSLRGGCRMGSCSPRSWPQGWEGRLKGWQSEWVSGFGEAEALLCSSLGSPRLPGYHVRPFLGTLGLLSKWRWKAKPSPNSRSQAPDSLDLEPILWLWLWGKDKGHQNTHPRNPDPVPLRGWRNFSEKKIRSEQGKGKEVKSPFWSPWENEGAKKLLFQLLWKRVLLEDGDSSLTFKEPEEQYPTLWYPLLHAGRRSY